MGKTATAILGALRDAAGPLCDGCLLQATGIAHRAAVNQECRLLAYRGELARGDGICSRCGQPRKTTALGQGARSVAIGAPSTRSMANGPIAPLAPAPTEIGGPGNDPVGPDAVILVACSAGKTAGAREARDLYRSELFARSRRYAEAHADRWFILSAKYGLLDPRRRIEPYDLTLNTLPASQRRQWAARVDQALQQQAPNVRQVTFLAGVRYREYLEPLLRMRGVVTRNPMRGLRIGEQLQWLGRHADRSTA